MKPLGAGIGAYLRACLPTQCLVCARWPADAALCRSCLQLPPQPRCWTCALPLPEGLDPGEDQNEEPHLRCAHCLRQPPPLVACYAALGYQAPWRGLIARWKFHQQAALARVLAEAMATQLPVAAILRAADVLLPLPASAARLQERGFHHTLLLAQALRRVAGVPEMSIPSQVLLRLPERTEASRPSHQAQRNRAERLRALRDAFVVPADMQASLQGARVLLLDDVMTTGATLYSAAQTLQQAGAASVSALVLARTPRA